MKTIWFVRWEDGSMTAYYTRHEAEEAQKNYPGEICEIFSADIAEESIVDIMANPLEEE